MNKATGVAVIAGIVIVGAAAVFVTSGAQAEAGNPGAIATDTATPVAQAPLLDPSPSVTLDTTKPTDSLSGGKPITIAEAAAVPSTLTAEYSDLTATYGVQTTLGAIADDFQTLASYQASDPVIVIVAVGKYTPQFGNGETFSWGALVIDPTNGVDIGSFAAPGAVPSVLTAQGPLSK